MFAGLIVNGCEKGWDERIQPSLAFTASLTFLPSTVFPASPAITAFMTLPMSLALAAPVSAIAAVDGRGNLVVGRRRRQIASRTTISACSLSARSCRPPFGELLDRIAALLDQHRHDLQFLRAFERAALLDALVRERGLQHAQRRELRLILGLHRRDDIGAQRLL